MYDKSGTIMEHLDYVIEQASLWLGKGNADIILNGTLHVHVRTACITKAVVNAPGPSYYVGFNTIFFVPSRSTEPSYVHPIVAHWSLQQLLLQACVEKYRLIMQKQTVTKQEITGIVACNTADADDVGLFFL
jgi:hypothetical protein